LARSEHFATIRAAGRFLRSVVNGAGYFRVVAVSRPTRFLKEMPLPFRVPWWHRYQFVSITAEDIKKVVLDEDDFGHEMRVGGILTSVKYPEIQYEQTYVLRPDHGGTYKDQVTGKTRQFDYRCQIDRGRDRSKKNLLAAECKNLNPDFPLVVCGRPRTTEESYHVFITQDDGKSLIGKVDGFNSLYKPDEFVGKSLLRLKLKDRKICADGDSEIYDRWSQALASSHDLALGAVLNRPPAKTFTFVMPLVVVPDNSLWIVSYNNEGSIRGNPMQVEQCEFYVDQKLPVGLPFVLTHIHFVTLKGLSQMLSGFVAARARIWDTIFNLTASVFNPAQQPAMQVSS
jgi:hypothetical protein